MIRILFCSLFVVSLHSVEEPISPTEEAVQVIEVEEEENLAVDQGPGVVSSSDQESTYVAKEYLVELRGEYFYILSDVMRDVYGAGWPSGEILIAEPFFKVANLKLWEAVGYSRKEGHALGSGDKTSFNLLFVTLGLRACYDTRYVATYLGVGARAYFGFGHNDSTTVPKDYSANAWGGVAEFGWLIHLNSIFDLDVFGAYDYGKMKASNNTPLLVYSNDIQVGGWRAGLGLGARF